MNDLRSKFKHTQVRKQNPDGDICLCDPDFDANCGYMSFREVSILKNLAGQFAGQRQWCDIGGHTGWSAAHIVIGAHDPCNYVHVIDPDYERPEFFNRTLENFKACGISNNVVIVASTSEEFFKSDERPKRFDGVCVDGHHTHPHPLQDAQMAYANLAAEGVIFFHDFNLASVQAAVEWCRSMRMKVRTYNTMWGCAACYRGKDIGRT